MKLVINTQICENYGAHDWDGRGACPQRWKFKGGSTFVVDNITPSQKARIERDGIPTLTSLIEENNESFREYILSAEVVSDDAPEGEEWETPFRLFYSDGTWVARREIDNTGEYGGSMRREIKTKFESYVMVPAAGRENYTASWELINGQFALDDGELRVLLDEMEDA